MDIHVEVREWKRPEAADLDAGAETVSTKHIADAVQYRGLDWNYWT
jgi:hypothetical protein